MKKNRKDIDRGKIAEKNDGKAKIPSEENPLFDILNDQNTVIHASRRNFLKLCGFSFAVSALSSCQSRIERVIPYIIAPDEITPGEAIHYASSYVNGNDYCSIIVKTRDGRPVKIEGNPESGITKGGTSARVQASVLDLYDGGRFHEPLREGTASGWEAIDNEIISRLKKISDENGTIILLTPSIYSPSTESVISQFIKKFNGSEWIQYDAISYSAILEANSETFGIGVIPDYRFDRADLIVSVGADFLGTWLSPVEYIKQFSSRRSPDLEMNYLVQLESNLSLTGCNADKRIPIKPSQETAILLNIYKDLLISSGNRAIDVPVSPIDISEISKKLIAAKGKSLVISGSNVKGIQLLVNEINKTLGNVGKTILFGSYLRTHAAIDNKMDNLVSRMQAGEIGAMLIWDVNPAYSWVRRDAFISGLKKIGLTVSLTGSPDETSGLLQFVCPSHHYLESWNDAEPKKNHFSLMQPVINPLFNTRQVADTLLKWSGSQVTFYDFIKNYWTEKLLKRQSEFKDPVTFFDRSLQKGIFEPAVSSAKPADNIKQIANSPIKTFWFKSVNNPAEGELEIVLYENIAVGEGRQSNNPWLQELPDPVSRICWDNYAAVSPGQAKSMQLSDGDVITLHGIELPVHIQPGQAEGTVGIALGYGRRACGMVGEGVGRDVWPLVSFAEENVVYNGLPGKIAKTGKSHLFAQTQSHHSMEGRALIRGAGLSEYRINPSAGNELHAFNTQHSKSLYKVREYPHHHWGMAIDLTRCTGCANCVIACQAENNVPVVGKEEVHRVHEMHWIRIDRYYNGGDDNPEVLFQPVFCQHCENAPCENVCPVAATNHSSEGLNQMIYNRCFGTRYCNNNCPYKVRRFNWFNYTEAGTLAGNLRDKAGMTGDLRRMVLNPDVTVRSQGVIEKCSFCIQRIQAAKLNAKKENRALFTNEIQTACSQSCPADAIVFGDLIDPESAVSKLIISGRKYNLLEELFTKPSINYLTRIRNNIT
jgi:Fe-S-cluster-containing dehydrogenase component/anaerobic selenocysteine-containing dehydrogenase